ncbi:MAG: flagellar basal body rod protein FlgF, partial [Burkholderiaceae bacterium]
NASSNGFRAELQAFRSVPIRGDGASTRAFSLETTTGHDLSAGPLQTTERNLDVAMKGKAWLAVQALDGTEAYTRAGSMDVNAEGVLTMRNGLQVMGDGGPITVPPNTTISIGEDGTVVAKGSNQPPVNIGKLKLVTEDGRFTRREDGLFASADGEPLPADATARVQSGALEGSNVSAVETMVGMIAAARQFEQQMKMLQIAQTHGQAASKLLSDS